MNLEYFEVACGEIEQGLGSLRYAARADFLTPQTLKPQESKTSRPESDERFNLAVPPLFALVRTTAHSASTADQMIRRTSRPDNGGVSGSATGKG